MITATVPQAITTTSKRYALTKHGENTVAMPDNIARAVLAAGEKCQECRIKSRKGRLGRNGNPGFKFPKH